MVIPKTPHSIPKMGITKILGYTYISDTRAILDIQLLTGRTHQIRYHLSSLGLAIVGDYVYGNNTGEPMGLTAYRLTCIDCD